MSTIYNPFSLEGKTVLVTGASSGIGRGVAVECSKMGASVTLLGRDKERLNQTMNLLEGHGHSQISCNLKNYQETKSIVTEFPKLDGIVHCAGVGQRVLCKQLTKEDVDEVMDSNFKAPVLLQAELIAQKKINKGGSIVFISSLASYSPSIGNSIYSASKGAIISYANCLSLELAPRQIRVNCISPAMVWTKLILSNGIDENQLKEDEAKYPLKRYGRPEDIAHLAIYMLSDASTWMTGSNVIISGGGK